MIALEKSAQQLIDCLTRLVSLAQLVTMLARFSHNFRPICSQFSSTWSQIWHDLVTILVRLMSICIIAAPADFWSTGQNPRRQDSSPCVYIYIKKMKEKKNYIGTVSETITI